MWGLRHSCEPNISCIHGCALQGDSAWHGFRCSFSENLLHSTARKKEYIVHALQMKGRNGGISFLDVSIIRVTHTHTHTHTPPYRIQGLTVLYCWWSCKRKKWSTSEMKPVCLSLASLLANRSWNIYRKHLHISLLCFKPLSAHPEQLLSCLPAM